MHDSLIPNSGYGTKRLENKYRDQKMKLYFTPAAQHLSLNIDGMKETYVSTTFSDGEKYIRVQNRVEGTVWVIANTNAPAENLLELFFLLDALRRLTNNVRLLIPYFAYARQDRITQEGECLGAKVISDFLRYFRIEKLVVFHMHSRRIKQYLDYEDVFPLELVSSLAKAADVVVSPDRGGIPFAKMVGKRCKLPVIHIEKKRISEQEVEVMEVSGEVKGKKAIIVDDMIATGGTIIKATEKLLSKGAKEVEVYATHGIFSGDAREKLMKSPIKQIYVTNSLPQKQGPRITVLDISLFLQDVIGLGHYQLAAR
jgi:ribose-phosphate pyrophosphokinase